MSNNDHNGRVTALAGNAMVMEMLRFGFWIVLFLWFASAVNGRISRNEQAHKRVADQVKRIEKTLKLPALEDQE